MPTAPLRPCNAPGCRELVPYGYCKAHATQRERTRGSAHERGYTRDWAKAAKAFRQEHPTCAECERRGIVKAATCVDHIRPHKGDQALFWSADNWQALCDACHGAKTAKEDGGFGRPVKAR